MKINRIMLSIILGIAAISSFSAAEMTIVKETGIASWYESAIDGALTANGERFNPEALTGAHKSLPFGTIVSVHNLANGKTVEVRINDRGPYVEGRIIDLTPAAAQAIDMLESGITPVELEIIYEPPIPESLYDRPGDTGWYQVQVGSFANTRTAYMWYTKLLEVGFKPWVQIAQETMLRLTIRWIDEKHLDESLKVLSALGFDNVLVKSEQNPYQ